LKRYRISLLASVLAALCLTGTPSAFAQQVKMKIGTATLKDTQHEWMLRFQKRMQEKAGDQLKIDLFPLGQLGTIPRAVEGMQLGTIEAYVTPSVFLVGLDSRAQAAWAPGVFDSVDHCWRTVADQEFRDYTFGMLEGKGITVISTICSATQAFLTKKDVKSLDDLKGLKIRVLASALERAQMQVLGISPTPIPFTEVLPALQRNVIDGVSSIPILFNNLKMFNTAKHITIAGLFHSSIPVYVSKVWWEKLPEDLRRTMLTEAKGIEKSLIDWNEKANVETLEKWRGNGGTVRSLSDAEQKRMIETVTPAVQKVIAEDPALETAYNKIRAIAAKNR